MNVRRLLFTALASLVAMAGCQKTTVEGPEGKKLTVIKPVDQTIKQGEADKVMVKISRANFRDAVTVRFEELPAGVKVQDKDAKIAAGDSTATFTLQAEPNAPPVDKHQAVVTVEGPDGMKASERFQVTIKTKG